LLGRKRKGHCEEACGKESRRAGMETDRHRASCNSDA
jgi:hypothetical protein